MFSKACQGMQFHYDLLRHICMSSCPIESIAVLFCKTAALEYAQSRLLHIGPQSQQSQTPCSMSMQCRGVSTRAFLLFHLCCFVLRLVIYLHFAAGHKEDGVHPVQSALHTMQLARCMAPALGLCRASDTESQLHDW